MNNEVFSNHIGNSSELTVLARIKQAFVPVDEPLPYAARLRLHLRMLSGLRRIGLETERAGVYVGPVDTLRTLQFVRWTLVEDDTKMLLSVNFDRAFEPYIRRIVKDAGPLLDTILCHCEGFEKHSSDQGFDAFIDFARRHQVPVELFAAAAPDVSVDDADYFVDLDATLRSGDPRHSQGPRDPDLLHARKRVKLPAEKLAESGQLRTLALLDQSLNILRVMYENADRFPEIDQNGERTRDDLLYYNLADKLLPGFWERLTGGLAMKAKAAGRTAPAALQGQPDANLVAGVKEYLGKAAGQNPHDRFLVRASELFAQFQEPLKWFATVPEKRDPEPAKAKGTPLEQENAVQRGLLSADADVGVLTVPAHDFKATDACLLLFRMDTPEGGGQFLERIGARLWPEGTLTQVGDGEAHVGYNLSITHDGLRALRIPESERLKFPEPFREGMERRAGLLGDIDVNHPSEWTWPVGNWPLDSQEYRPIAPSTIDLVVQVSANLPGETGEPPFDVSHPLFGLVKQLADEAAQDDVTLLAVEPMQRRFEEEGQVRGHLGFADGISQPAYAVAGSPDKLGDILLGHEDSRDKDGFYTRPGAILQDGTFQVIRKVRMDVAAFEAQTQSVVPPDGSIDPETIRAKMIGRNKDGTLLTGGAANQDPDFGTDAEGMSTPLQSHVRRVNPRDGEAPRILRRGFSYGPRAVPGQADDVDRGLYFIAYNASIAEQFEVIQRWVSGGNSTGIASWHGDPLLAPRRAGGNRNFRFHDGSKVMTVPLPDTPAATLQWGLYAFNPSRRGLSALAKIAGTRHLETGFAESEAPSLRPALDADKDAPWEAWKLVLEDPDDWNRPRRERLWAQVRDRGGVLRTEYGVLVGSKDAVLTVLDNDDRAFSTSEYLARMDGSIGKQYLGLDAGDQYDEESAVLNGFLDKKLEAGLFAAARSQAQALLAGLPEERRSRPDDGKGATPDVKELGRRLESERFIYETVAQLCVRWFGLPGDLLKLADTQDSADARPHCPRDLLPSSFYVFGPHPTDFVTQRATTRTPEFVAAVEAGLNDSGTGAPGNLRQHIGTNAPAGWSDRKKAEFISGACFGFVGPVSGSFRSVLFDWIDQATLWRLHLRYRDAVAAAGGSHFDTAKNVLRPAILESMAKRPVPDLLHRKVVEEMPFTALGSRDARPESTIAPSDFVVTSLRSAIADGGEAEELLFGGDYVANPNAGPQHKCPGKSMGIATLMGAFSAIFDATEIRPEGPLSVWLKGLPAA